MQIQQATIKCNDFFIFTLEKKQLSRNQSRPPNFKKWVMVDHKKYMWVKGSFSSTKVESDALFTKVLKNI